MRAIRWSVLVFAVALSGTEAFAQTPRGFQLNRYEPSSAGSWFLAVERPWYNSTRDFAIGLTLNYAHNPLVAGVRDASGNFSKSQPVVEHQLTGHVDVAGSLWDRVHLSATLPVVFLERGEPLLGVTPLDAIIIGDPRIGAMIRVFGQPEKDAISMHLGAHFWVPLGMDLYHAGEAPVKVLPKLILAGLGGPIRWNVNAGVLIRQTASIGRSPDLVGNTVGTEFQLAAALGYTTRDHRLNVGPEANFATVIVDGRAFQRDFTSLEVLASLHYLVNDTVLLGVGGGIGVLREPGTPDGRLVARLAYAPLAKPEVKPIEIKDLDKDGVADELDACPDVAGVTSSDPKLNGCPQVVDRDGDGVPDGDDLCPDLAAGANPDPMKRGCALVDSDGDGVFDHEDLCPQESAGQTPDAAQRGCPLRDQDGDGVLDPNDACVDVAQGSTPDPRKLGCPLLDRDRDSVPDDIDACPDKAGAPASDPKKSGCPGLVEVKNGQIVILQQVFFATAKDVILAKSFPVLLAVADVLKSQSYVKRVAVEGHTDDRGKPEANRELSDRRAKSVMKWLTEHTIAAERLEAKGYGPDKPIDSNKTATGRAKNRRVEFRIVNTAAN